MKALAIFIFALVGQRPHEPDGIWQHIDAIFTATENEEERRVLAVIALHETWFDLNSRTPPFGLTERLERGLPRLSVAASAPVALRVLRYLRGRCASLGAPSWSAVLGRYHRGTAGPLQGCVADRLALVEVRRAGVR